MRRISDDIAFDVGLAEEIGTRYDDVTLKTSKPVLRTRVIRPSAGDAAAPILVRNKDIIPRRM